MDQACPWDFLPPAAIDFCEANRCGWVVEPMNTLSSFAFVIVGAFLWRKSQKEGATGLLAATGPICILIGLFSATLHTSMTQMGNFLDLASMYLLATLLLFFNWRRYRIIFGKPVRERRERLYYIFTICTLLLVHAFWMPAGVPMFGALVIAYGILEILLWIYRRKTGKKIKYGHFRGLALSFGLSFLVWTLDISQTLCWRNSVFQGHAIWHVGCAISVIYAYLYFSQFPQSVTGDLRKS